VRGGKLREGPALPPGHTFTSFGGFLDLFDKNRREEKKRLKEEEKRRLNKEKRLETDAVLEKIRLKKLAAKIKTDVDYGKERIKRLYNDMVKNELYMGFSSSYLYFDNFIETFYLISISKNKRYDTEELDRMYIEMRFAYNRLVKLPLINQGLPYKTFEEYVESICENVDNKLI